MDFSLALDVDRDLIIVIISLTPVLVVNIIRTVIGTDKITGIFGAGAGAGEQTVNVVRPERDDNRPAGAGKDWSHVIPLDDTGTGVDGCRFRVCRNKSKISRIILVFKRHRRQGGGFTGLAVNIGCNPDADRIQVKCPGICVG